MTAIGFLSVNAALTVWIGSLHSIKMKQFSMYLCNQPVMY